MTVTHEEILKQAEMFERGGMRVDELHAWCKRNWVTSQQWMDFCRSRAAYHHRGAQIWLVVFVLVLIAIFLVFLL